MGNCACHMQHVAWAVLVCRPCTPPAVLNPSWCSTCSTKACTRGHGATSLDGSDPKDVAYFKSAGVHVHAVPPKRSGTRVLCPVKGVYTSHSILVLHMESRHMSPCHVHHHTRRAGTCPSLSAHVRSSGVSLQSVRKRGRQWRSARP